MSTSFLMGYPTSPPSSWTRQKHLFTVEQACVPSPMEKIKPHVFWQWCLWSHADLPHCLMRASDTEVLHVTREDVTVSRVTPKQCVFFTSFSRAITHFAKPNASGFPFHLYPGDWGKGGVCLIPANEILVARHTRACSCHPAGSKECGIRFG